MRIGVFSVLFQQLPFEAALDKIAAAGATAVEIGAGGYCGTHHCPIDELLESAEKRKAYLSAIHSRGLILSGLNSTWEPLHPDKKLAQASAEVFPEERAAGANARSPGGDGPYHRVRPARPVTQVPTGSPAPGRRITARC